MSPPYRRAAVPTGSPATIAVDPITERGNRVERRGLSAYIAELVGTFLVVLFIALVVSVYARKGIAMPEFVVIGLLHAFVLGMLIQTLGGVLGRAFQPRGHGRARERAQDQRAQTPGGYIVVQIVGAIAGAAFAELILDELPGGPNLGNPSISADARRKATSGAPSRALGASRRVGGHGRGGEPARRRRLGRSS